ncbi:hypothetical protein ABID22_001431 [Pontibacter aydingkolensis]
MQKCNLSHQLQQLHHLDKQQLDKIKGFISIILCKESNCTLPNALGFMQLAQTHLVKLNIKQYLDYFIERNLHETTYIIIRPDPF